MYVRSLAGSTVLTSGFTNGAGHIWFEAIQCDGNENRLLDCTHPVFGTHHTCVHGQDAGVSCSITQCTNGAVTLKGGTATQGRIEVCINGREGTVCDEGWEDVDARIACLQLGLPSSSEHNVQVCSNYPPALCCDG